MNESSLPHSLTHSLTHSSLTHPLTRCLPVCLPTAHSQSLTAHSLTAHSLTAHSHSQSPAPSPLLFTHLPSFLPSHSLTHSLTGAGCGGACVHFAAASQLRLTHRSPLTAPPFSILHSPSTSNFDHFIISFTVQYLTLFLPQCMNAALAFEYHILQLPPFRYVYSFIHSAVQCHSSFIGRCRAHIRTGCMYLFLSCTD